MAGGVAMPGPLANRSLKAIKGLQGGSLMRRHRWPAAVCAIRIFVACALLGVCSLASAGELSGKWAGMWEDDGSGHAGPLKAHISRNCDGSYHCRFHGRFMKIIPF